MNGKVYLVGAGPGDPELLTLKAFRIVQAAQFVLHDDLVSPEILALLPPSARIFNVGKRCGKKKITQQEINERMVSTALAGLDVLRLKGGDPAVFGRLGEEIEVLQAADIEFEIVPGITAASAAAAAAKIALTQRGLASSLVLLPGHAADENSRPGSQSLAPHLLSAQSPAPQSPPPTNPTLVMYMTGRRVGHLAFELVAAGWQLD